MAAPSFAAEERSVAATKSMIASLVAGLSLAGRRSEDAELVAALDRLPAILEASRDAPPDEVVETLGKAGSLYVIRARRHLRRRR